MVLQPQTHLEAEGPPLPHVLGKACALAWLGTLGREQTARSLPSIPRLSLAGMSGLGLSSPAPRGMF